MASATQTAWEVRPTAGSDANGGGFDASLGGHDYTQQNSAQASGTVNSQTDATHVVVPGTNMVSDMTGNYIKLSGTGWTTNWYLITAVGPISSAVSLTLATSPGTLTGTGTFAIGGALAHTTTAANSAMAGQNTVWVKATGTDAVTATITPPAGANDKPTQVLGYTTTRGDGGLATIQISSGSFHLVTNTNVVCWYKNLIVDVNGATSARGISSSGAQALIENVEVKNFTDYGIVFTGGPATCSKCWAHGGIAGATAGFYGGSTDIDFIDCAATNNACKGWRFDANPPHCVRCIAANNTGSTAYHGFYVNAGQALRLLNVVAWNNGGSGLRLDTAGASNTLILRNAIIGKNAQYGIDNQTGTTSLSGEILADYNALGSSGAANTSGARNNFPTGTHDTTVSGDPFVNSGGTPTSLADVFANFQLDSTAGEGANCRAAGYPSYLDIGAVQHQDAGGGGGIVGGPIIARPTSVIFN